MLCRVKVLLIEALVQGGQNFFLGAWHRDPVHVFQIGDLRSFPIVDDGAADEACEGGVFCGNAGRGDVHGTKAIVFVFFASFFAAFVIIDGSSYRLPTSSGGLAPSGGRAAKSRATAIVRDGGKTLGEASFKPTCYRFPPSLTTTLAAGIGEIQRTAGSTAKAANVFPTLLIILFLPVLIIIKVCRTLDIYIYMCVYVCEFVCECMFVFLNSAPQTGLRRQS